MRTVNVLINLINNFVFNLFFLSSNFTGKTVGFSGIRTQIVGVEGKLSDHLIATMAHNLKILILEFK